MAAVAIALSVRVVHDNPGGAAEPAVGLFLGDRAADRTGTTGHL